MSNLFTFSLKLPEPHRHDLGPLFTEAMDWDDALDEEEGQVDRMSRSGSWPVAAMVENRVRSGCPGSESCPAPRARAGAARRGAHAPPVS